MTTTISNVVRNCTDWDEETWYALTDGMEGDYPGPGFDYDTLGFGG